MIPLLPIPESPTDWIRIFATCLARRRPQVAADTVVQLAIENFRRCPALSPEVAADQFGEQTQSTERRLPSVGGPQPG